jgi:hypothetical protein
MMRSSAALGCLNYVEKRIAQSEKAKNNYQIPPAPLCKGGQGGFSWFTGFKAVMKN